MLYVNCSHIPGEKFCSQPVKDVMANTSPGKNTFHLFIVFVSRRKRVQGCVDVRAEIMY